MTERTDIEIRGAGTAVAREAHAFVERSTSPATRLAYRSAVREFAAYLDGELLATSPDDVRRWRDDLARRGQKPRTIARKLSIVRSLFRYLQAMGTVRLNPAATELVPPPALPDETTGRALTDREVKHLLAGPDRATATGARDYALMLLMLRTSLRAAEACSLRRSSFGTNKGYWVVSVRVKGGRDRVLPLPDDVKAALDAYLELDLARRNLAARNKDRSRVLAPSDAPDAHIFQPSRNNRTLETERAITVQTCENIVKRWAEYAGLGRVLPHDLRRTAITRARDLGATDRQLQAMTGHKDRRSLDRYDHNRFNLDENAIHILRY